MIFTYILERNYVLKEIFNVTDAIKLGIPSWDYPENKLNPESNDWCSVEEKRRKFVTHREQSQVKLEEDIKILNS